MKYVNTENNFFLCKNTFPQLYFIPKADFFGLTLNEWYGWQLLYTLELQMIMIAILDFKWRLCANRLNAFHFSSNPLSDTFFALQNIFIKTIQSTILLLIFSLKIFYVIRHYVNKKIEIVTDKELICIFLYQVETFKNSVLDSIWESSH